MFSVPNLMLQKLIFFVYLFMLIVRNASDFPFLVKLQEFLHEQL